jgi:hypothetical protein
VFGKIAAFELRTPPADLLTAVFFDALWRVPIPSITLATSTNSSRLSPVTPTAAIFMFADRLRRQRHRGTSIHRFAHRKSTRISKPSYLFDASRARAVVAWLFRSC